ncbi:metal-sulfur cluster biosynthetic enzyme [Bacillus fengqiuensis]|nr:metal-sulfur cluster biosynthetic enzyme [Bacillus fengqiuensis]
MNSREREVFKKLDTVYDPELDQSLPELGFIKDVKIDGSEVHIAFRLPTYWCSPNFAFIMAEDIQKSVSQLDWVSRVKVTLDDHCASKEINDGVGSGKTFNQTFQGMSTGELDELRRTFRVKTFYARQERLIRHLLYKAEIPVERLIQMTIHELKEISDLDSEGYSLKSRYLLIREELVSANHSRAIAFITPEGKPMNVEKFPEYFAMIKRTRLSMEFNGNYCRSLFETRYNLEQSSVN